MDAPKPRWAILPALAPVAAFLLAMLSLATPASAGPSAFDAGSRGFGVFIGFPAGATFKFRLKGYRAVDAGIASSLGKYFFAHSDYLIRISTHEGTELYAGAGAGLLFSGIDVNSSFFNGASGPILLCVRAPIGFEYAVPDSSVGVYLEGVPNLAILPSLIDFFQAGLGVRVYL
ncbi:MAG: hypothetical protein EBX52_04690 [Proteobacteria bacterium]|nr:hypothetical protein [Pseudomonadota bacterium]